MSHFWQIIGYIGIYIGVGLVVLLIAYQAHKDRQERDALIAKIKARGPLGTVVFHEDGKVTYEPNKDFKL